MKKILSCAFLLAILLSLPAHGLGQSNAPHDYTHQQKAAQKYQKSLRKQQRKQAKADARQAKAYRRKHQQ